MLYYMNNNLYNKKLNYRSKYKPRLALHGRGVKQNFVNMILGRKPLWVFTYFPINELEKYLKEDQYEIVKYKINTLEWFLYTVKSDKYNVIDGLITTYDEIDRINLFINNMKNKNNISNKEFHTNNGLLLGYKKEDINYYLDYNKARKIVLCSFIYNYKLLFNYIKFIHKNINKDINFFLYKKYYLKQIKKDYPILFYGNSRFFIKEYMMNILKDLLKYINNILYLYYDTTTFVFKLNLFYEDYILIYDNSYNG